MSDYDFEGVVVMPVLEKVSFEQFYACELRRHKLIEGECPGGRVISSTHWCGGFLRRSFPKVLGRILEKPVSGEFGLVSLTFRVRAAPRGKVWDFLKALEAGFPDVMTRIIPDEFYPAG